MIYVSILIVLFEYIPGEIFKGSTSYSCSGGPGSTTAFKSSYINIFFLITNYWFLCWATKYLKLTPSSVAKKFHYTGESVHERLPEELILNR